MRYIRVGALLGLAGWMAACSAPPPTIDAVEIDPQPSALVPLAAEVRFRTDRPTTVVVEITDDTGVRMIDTRFETATDHVVPIFGMRPGRTSTVRLVVADEDGVSATSEPIELAREPLPEGFPPLDVRVDAPLRMEPGVTLVEATYLAEPGAPEGSPWLFALDEFGEVVWYYASPHAIRDSQRMANGHFLYGSGNTDMYEVDMMGTIVAHWRSTNLASDDEEQTDAVGVATDTLHHETFEAPWGNLMALSTEVREIPGYWTSETDPNAPRRTSRVVGDVIIEFTRAGDIVRSLHLLDLFDPYRIGYGSLGGFWLTTYPGQENPARDWSHANGIALDETGRYLLVSMRHQGAVAKLDLETSEIVWILGAHGGWEGDLEELLLEPIGEITWPADQHAPMTTPDGTVLMFDNGTNRARPFDPPMPAAESYSRAVEYRVDEAARTVEEVWSYGGPPDERYYAWRVGDADWMPETGNVLITYGGLSTDAEGNSISANGHNMIRIVEVTRTTPAEKVFELLIDDERPRGWLSFQGERLPSLYP